MIDAETIDVLRHYEAGGRTEAFMLRMRELMATDERYCNECLRTTTEDDDWVRVLLGDDDRDVVWFCTFICVATWALCLANQSDDMDPEWAALQRIAESRA